MIEEVEESTMTEKEIAEIRRHFRPDKTSITAIRGCYVNDRREVVSEFNQSLALMPEDEADNLLALLRRTLSGTVQKNLLDLTFDTQQVVDSEEHRLLMRLRDSELKEDEAVQTLFSQIIASLDLDSNYLILLTFDKYDVPYRSKDGDKQADASSEVYSYILCGICPIKTTKPALSYSLNENEFHNCKENWIVAPPELGFLFPAFDDRSANLYNALYYSRDIAETHQAFVEAIFRRELPMPAMAQKETFQSMLSDTLDEECSYEVVQAVHEQLCELVEEHKANKEPDVLLVSKSKVKGLLQTCGVSEERVAAFEEKYDTQFGSETELSPLNIVDTKQFVVNTPDVTIRVSPENSGLIETRVIDGIKYLLIRASEGVELNGVPVHISQSEQANELVTV